MNHWCRVATLLTSCLFADPNTQAVFRGISVYRDDDKKVFKVELEIIGNLESQTKSDNASFVAKHYLLITELAEKSKYEANFPKDFDELQALA